MPPGFNPMTTSRQNKRIIHLQGLNCDTPSRRQTNERYPVLAPAEMLLPRLGARMKQRYFFLGLRVEAMRLSPFVAIAPSTSQAHIALVRTPTTREGENMINMHLRSADFLGGLAVFAAVMGGSGYLVADRSGDGIHGGTLDLAEEGLSPTQAEESVGTCFEEGPSAIFLT